MDNGEWRLQDAKTQLSQVVKAALSGVPQHITRRGRRAVVVLSEASFQALQQRAQEEEHRGLIDHLLAMPRDDGAFENAVVPLRDAGF